MNRKQGTVIALLVLVLTFLFNFVKKAVKKGRTMELVSSTFVLGLSYMVLYSLKEVVYWGYWIPLIGYAVYWLYLFSHEKVTSPQVNLKWADKSWWWSLDGWEFEEEVAKIYRLNGYEATVTKKTGDGGADIILYKDNEKYAVQCKHWKYEVPVSCARELKGIQEDLKADKLIMIASSGLTQPAEEFLKGKPYYTALNLEDLIEMALRPNLDRP